MVTKGRALLWIVCFLLVLPVGAQTDPPPERRSLRLFLELYTRHHHDLRALRRALVAARIEPKVDRICYVAGGYPEQVACMSLERVLGSSFRLPPADRELLELAMNDLWEALGGTDPGGVLTVCGGQGWTGVTNLLATQPLGRLGATAPKKRAATAQSLGGIEAARMVSRCRDAQTAAIRGGIGSYTPGSPSYRRAVERASTFLTGLEAGCSDGDTGMIEDGAVPVPQDRGKKQMTTGEALGWVAGVTQDLAETLAAAGDAGGMAEACRSTSQCALKVVGAAIDLSGIGLVADAGELTGEDGGVLGKVDVAADIVGFAVDLMTAGGTTATAEMILPLAGAAVVGYTVGTPIGEYIAEEWDFVYRQIAANPNDEPLDTGGKAGGGAGRPAPEGGKPSCETLAARAANFLAYCSQPGNNWQSYDCMLFVARLNGCADPGLVRPAPGEDFTCPAQPDRAASRKLACEHHARVKEWLSRSPQGSASNCGVRIDGARELERRMERDLCHRVMTDGAGTPCPGLR